MREWTRQKERWYARDSPDACVHVRVIIYVLVSRIHARERIARVFERAQTRQHTHTQMHTKDKACACAYAWTRAFLSAQYISSAIFSNINICRYMAIRGPS